MHKAITYIIFCLIATFVNLGAQRVVLAVFETPFAFYMALFAGTALGLMTKYFLDKNWIFGLQGSQEGQSEVQRFTLYSATGLFTTLIFWGCESVFWFTYGTSSMREMGAVLGLTVGYVIKYYLDSRFVFQQVYPRGFNED